MRYILILTLFCFASELCSQPTLIRPGDLTEGDLFGFVTDIHDNDLVINSHSSDLAGENTGALYHYRYNGAEWVYNQQLLPMFPEDDGGYHFGMWVAVSEHWLLAALPGNDGIGSVVFYRRSDENSMWQRHSKISQPQPDSEFGWQIDVQGNRALIGAVNEDNADGLSTGAAFLYEYSANSDAWEQTVRFEPEGLQSGDFFGSAVYLNGDIAAISARFDSEKAEKAGAVYVFERQEGDWNQMAKLVPSDVQDWTYIGYRISGSGDRLIFSGYGNDSNTGSVYIYRNVGEWQEETRLYADDLQPGDWFGSGVAIDGNRAVVGARYQDSGTGAAYVFELVDSDWIQVDKLLSAFGEPESQFGIGVSYHNNQLIVGASSSNNFAGVAYAYTLDEIVANEQLEQQVLQLHPNPTQDNLRLTCDLLELYELEIYSMQGALLASQPYDGETVEVSHLSAGIYLLLGKGTSGEVFNSKFVKF